MGSSWYAYGEKRASTGTYTYHDDSIVYQEVGGIGSYVCAVNTKTGTWSVSVTPLFVAPNVSSVSYPTDFASVSKAVLSNGKWIADSVVSYTSKECYEWGSEQPTLGESSRRVTPSVLVTVQQHYYEFGDAAGDTTLDFADVEDKDDKTHQIELLNLFGFSLKDWSKSFAEANGTNASSVANTDLTFEITKDGKDATTDFFNGKEGDYQVAGTAVNSTNQSVPKGGKDTSAPITVTLTNDARTKAKAEVEAKRAEVEKGLKEPNLPDLTDEQREALLKKADDEARKATEAIDAATSTADITTAKTNGIAELDKILPEGELTDKHEAARKDLDAYAAKAKAEVNGRADLTDAERKEYSDQVDAEVKKVFADDGSGTVDQATTAEGITKALSEAKKAIDQITVEAAGKDAEHALDAKAEEARKQIDVLANLPDPDESGKTAEQQKQEAKAAIDKALATAKDAVSDAVTKSKDGTLTADKAKEQIDSAKDTAFEAFSDQADALSKRDVDTLKAKQEQANSDLDKKAEDAKKAIDALPDLSEEDRDKAKADVDKTVSDAKQEIASKTTVADIDTVIDQRGQEIGRRVDQAELDDVKAVARKELEAKAAEIDKRIDAKQYLTDAQKRELHERVIATLKEYIAKVDAASDAAGVAVVKQTGLDALDAIDGEVDKVDEEARQQQLEEAKSNAKADLDAKAEQAKKQVDALKEVDQASKDKAKAEIDRARDEAKAGIDQATDAQQVRAERQAGIEAIDKVVAGIMAEDKAILDEAKSDAIKRLEAKAAEVDKLIDAKQYLTDAQKRELHERVAATLAEYVAKVNAAESIADVATAKQAGLEALEAIGADATRLDEEAAARLALSDTGSAVLVPALLAVFAVLLGAGLALSRRHMPR